jgi:pyruvate,water dikinase
MLVYKNSTDYFAREESGGKGYNLYLLTRMGLPVPGWVILGTRIWRQFLAETQLADEITKHLRTFQNGKAPADTTATAITQLIAEAPLPASIVAAGQEAYERLGLSSVIAVRSSAADEDCPTHSFAGQLSSFLFVVGFESAARCLKQCWASAFSARALVYRQENRLSFENIRVAVIFQKMLDPDKAGVLFTCDPVAKTVDVFTVSAVYGVGEGLVSGALPADTFWLDAASGTVRNSAIVTKVEALRRSGRVPLPAPLQQTPSLSEAELRELHALAKTVQRGFPAPQDVEWAIAGGKFYVLQTRPVTTLDENLTGYPNLWDNSNIVESYGGLTSPLSFTFALNNYRSVYVQFCEILGVPHAVIKDMNSYLSHMLGCIQGRVYYNLYNWYKLVGVLPGFRHNRQFMETMMGVSESLSPEIADRIEPHPSWNTFRGKLRKVIVGLKFLLFHYRAQAIVDQFLRKFHVGYLKYRQQDYTRLTSDRILQIYLDMERTMISQWKAPIINDFLCMVHFGLLKMLTERWLSDLDANIQNDLLASEGNLESAEPTKVLIRLAGQVAVNPKLRSLVENTPPCDLMEALNQSSFQEFYRSILDYIERFGFRCMSEMKLEESDLYADPSYLFTCLKNYLRTGTTDLATYEQQAGNLRENAERKVHANLRGLRRWIYLWSLKHARRAVRNRENTRFARTRIYGVARAMFRAMGADLAARRIIESPQDIFYLTLDEIYGIHFGTLPDYTVSAFVGARKAAYAQFAATEPQPRFQTRGPVYWQNRYQRVTETFPATEGSHYDLHGLPCSPGIVEGIVRVVLTPQDDLNLNREILAAPRTDPGWIPLYPSVSGLLVEKGSLLSHSAIVAREMGLPTIVGVRGLTGALRTGMRVRMDGQRGTITILDDHA